MTRALPLLLILCTAAVICLLPRQNHAKHSTMEDETTSQNTTVHQVHGTGFVEPVSDVRALSFDLGGVISACHVSIGDSVEEGTVLAELNSREEQQSLVVADAGLRLARLEHQSLMTGVNPFEIQAAEELLERDQERVAYADRDLKRIRQLHSQSAISFAEFDEAASQLRKATAEMRQAEAHLLHLRNYVTPEEEQVAVGKIKVMEARRELAARRLELTKLRAPFDGTILEVLRKQGEAVSEIQREPVILFADRSRLQVRAEIDDRYVQDLEIGQKVDIFGRALGGRRYSGQLTLIKPVMGERTVFAKTANEKKDIDVIQVFVELEADFVAPVGLRVDVAVTVH